MTTVSRRDFMTLSGLAALGLGLFSQAGARRASASPLNDDDPALHMLRRTTWGVRPDDIARIQELGIEGYIDWQLNPDAIADPLVDDFMGGRRILSMGFEELGVIASDQYDTVLLTMLWARLFRAAYSERQVYELMVEFWTDHFNIPIGDYIREKIVDDREVIRKHALGRFRDLLFASAQSPAMLMYLDNAVSHRDHPNENYARELMELHTLGVDGGYTEQDVVEVARAFTGWTLREGYPGLFFFDPEMHDMDAKTVLGVQLPAGRGIEDGLTVLDLLARHPSTARFVSFKLARRFVSDMPPQSLVDGMAQVFSATDGDLKAVLRFLLLSPEFAAAQGQKFRRPIEFVVAMLRALTPGLRVENPVPLGWSLEALGQLPFFWHPPNGYPDVAGAWINTSGLLNRWNLALLIGLAGDGYFDGLALNVDQIAPQVATAGELVDAVVARLLGGARLGDADRQQLLAYVSRTGDAAEALSYEQRATKLPGIIGLVLASPYFQWR